MDHEQAKGTHTELRSAFQSPTFDRDVQIRVNETVGSASISPSGRDVVLASREGLHIIDLDSPYSQPRHLAHHSLWDVADVQWSPFAARDSWIVSTSNQKALVWNLDLYSPHAPIEHILHAHSRAITDINFSAHHPDLLATCAVDSFVHCWDLRHPAKPAMTYADWNAGATQVKWNRQDAHIIASSHDKFLKIWDDRKGAYPLKIIEAHTTKIYGIDWNRTRATGILTCSLDRTIKLWDYSRGDDEPERVIKTSFPVWRARHTPFGSGLLAMPQRGNSNLHLYDRRLEEGSPREAWVRPVHSFDGHNGQVKEFLWRARGGVENGTDNRDFQLISWGTDRDVHLHRIDPRHLRAVGHEKGKDVRKRLILTRLGAVYKTFRDEKPRGSDDGLDIAALRNFRPQGLGALVTAAGMSKTPLPLTPVRAEAGFMTSSLNTYGRRHAKKSPNAMKWIEGVKIGHRGADAFDSLHRKPSALAGDTPESLSDEMTFVARRYKNVMFENADVHGRVATVTLNGPWGQNDKPVFLRINFEFPPSYPMESMPEITFERTTSMISDDVMRKLNVEIFSIIEHYKDRRRGCLEAVITYLLGERGLEESMTLTPHGGPYTSPADESSSDEEDGVGGQQDLETSGAGLAAQTNVPLPRTSGAIWARHGQLLCFRPPKPGATPLFSLDALRNADRGRKMHRQFEGFGWLMDESTGPKDRYSGSDDDHENSSSGSWTSSSSSSSSDESEDISRLPPRFHPPTAWRAAMLRNAQKPSSHSSGGAKKVLSPKAKSVVSIYDMTDLLPAKRVLAKEYQIFGDGPSLCEHNSEVAERLGLYTLAGVWELCKQILYDEVPLEIMDQHRRKDPILVLAKRNIVRIKRKDSGLDLGFDEPDAVAKPKLTARVKWGKHPLASSWLIPTLFEHFEKLGDVQMLAMLSCVFCEPATREGVSNALLSFKQEDLPIAMKTAAFSLDYFPSKEVAWSLFQDTKATSRITTPAIGLSHAGGDYFSRNHTTYGSYGSSNGPWAGDIVTSGPITPFSTGNTPPTLSRQHTTASSLSTSPEPSVRAPRRSNSSLSTAFASFSKPFTTTASSSPPVHERLRNESDLSTSAPTSGITWGTNTFYIDSGPSSPVQRRKSNTRSSSFAPNESTFDSSDDEYDVLSDEDDARTEIMPAVSTTSQTVKITLKNQHLFDDESYASVPLLDPLLFTKYAVYRELYANILGIWDLHVSQAEILKFNGLTPYWPQDHAHAGQWYNPAREPSVSFDSSRSSNLLKPSIPSSTLQVAPGPQSPRKLSQSHSPSRPLNPTAPAFTPQPQLFQAQGGITRLTKSSSSRDLHGLLNLPSAPAQTQQPERFDIHNLRDYPQQPTLLQRATDRARLKVEGRQLEVREPQFRSCIVCWELVRGVHLVCSSGKHKGHMDCIQGRINEMPDSLGLDCECKEGIF